MISLSEINEIIISRIPYFDVVKLWTYRPLIDSEMRTLESLSGRKPDCRSEEKKFYPYNYRYLITLSQPRDEAFSFLDKVLEGRYFLNYIEFALDLITETRLDAEEVQDFLDGHQIKLWRGKQQLGYYQTTTYSSKDRWVNNEIVRYSDKPSKMNGRHCCHVEWRMCGAGTIRTAGINNLLNLMDFDHRNFWKKRIQLREIKRESLGKYFMKHSRRKKPLFEEYVRGRPFNVYRRIGNVIERGCQLENKPIVSIQKLIDDMHRKKEKKGRRRTQKSIAKLHLDSSSHCLRKLPNDVFLPS